MADEAVVREFFRDRQWPRMRGISDLSAAPVVKNFVHRDPIIALLPQGSGGVILPNFQTETVPDSEGFSNWYGLCMRHPDGGSAARGMQ
jgi:hypothetical protein